MVPPLLEDQQPSGRRQRRRSASQVSLRCCRRAVAIDSVDEPDDAWRAASAFAFRKSSSASLVCAIASMASARSFRSSSVVTTGSLEPKSVRGLSSALGMELAGLASPGPRRRSRASSIQCLNRICSCNVSTTKVLVRERQLLPCSLRSQAIALALVHVALHLQGVDPEILIMPCSVSVTLVGAQNNRSLSRAAAGD